MQEIFKELPSVYKTYGNKLYKKRTQRLFTYIDRVWYLGCHRNPTPPNNTPRIIPEQREVDKSIHKEMFVATSW